MNDAEKKEWEDYLASLPDVALSYVHLFVRKLTDTECIVDSLAIDYLCELEELCVYVICFRFFDRATDSHSSELQSDSKV